MRISDWSSDVCSSDLGEPRLLRFQAGRRGMGWAGNVAAIGLSSGFLEPLESTRIFLIQAAVTDLAALMPRRGEKVDARMRAEFNRMFEIYYERTRDFIVLHLAASSVEMREGKEGFNKCK